MYFNRQTQDYRGMQRFSISLPRSRCQCIFDLSNTGIYYPKLAFTLGIWSLCMSVLVQALVEGAYGDLNENDPHWSTGSGTIKGCGLIGVGVA